MRITITLLVILISVVSLRAQCPAAGMQFNLKSATQYALSKQSMQAYHDATGKPYMYVAGKERGLVIYDISNPAVPVQVDSVPITQLNNMEVMNLSQNGSYLYLALGNHFVAGSKPGIAIVDVSTPSNATVTDTWDWPTTSSGSGIVISDGNYAYLGAMLQGLLILDVSNKSSIGFVSQFNPTKNWPNPSFPTDTLKYNVRGMEIKGNHLYLCHDAGGIRVLDISNKLLPVEVGKYSNAAIYGQHRAYNNIVIDDTLAYVGLDYCGMEVLNISNPANIKQVSWWNPWQCDTGINKNDNWSNNNGHVNDVRLYKPCKLLFMSTGKSDMLVVNVSIPSAPKICDSFGSIVHDTAGSWGVSIYQNKIFLTYIFAFYIPIITPFGSNWGGVKIITWNNQCATSVASTPLSVDFTIYPNPASGLTTLQFNQHIENISLDIYNVLGQNCLSRDYKTSQNKLEIDFQDLPPGSYYLSLRSGDLVLNKHLSVVR